MYVNHLYNLQRFRWFDKVTPSLHDLALSMGKNKPLKSSIRHNHDNLAQTFARYHTIDIHFKIYAGTARP
jgi:hypothetical protein